MPGASCKLCPFLESRSAANGAQPGKCVKVCLKKILLSGRYLARPARLCQIQHSTGEAEPPNGKGMFAGVGPRRLHSPNWGRTASWMDIGFGLLAKSWTHPFPAPNPLPPTPPDGHGASLTPASFGRCNRAAARVQRDQRCLQHRSPIALASTRMYPLVLSCRR